MIAGGLLPWYSSPSFSTVIPNSCPLRFPRAVRGSGRRGARAAHRFSGLTCHPHMCAWIDEPGTMNVLRCRFACAMFKGRRDVCTSVIPKGCPRNTLEDPILFYPRTLHINSPIYIHIHIPSLNMEPIWGHVDTLITLLVHG